MFLFMLQYLYHYLFIICEMTNDVFVYAIFIIFYHLRNDDERE